MDEGKQKYLLVSHPLGYGPRLTLFFAAILGMLLGQALPEAAAFVRERRSEPNPPALGWERAGLFFSALFMCFWASRFKARTVYDVTP